MQHSEVVTSWVFQRILVEFKRDGLALFQMCFAVSVSNLVKRQKLCKNSQLFNLVKTGQVCEKLKRNWMKQEKPE